MPGAKANVNIENLWRDDIQKEKEILFLRKPEVETSKKQTKNPKKKKTTTEEVNKKVTLDDEDEIKDLLREMEEGERKSRINPNMHIKNNNG